MKISIITISYNAESYIEETIKSVITQQYKDIEYIIVDGLSTDNTLNIVNLYRDSIDVVISEKDDSIYDAYNKGVERASGEYILFLNADDYLFDSNAIYNFVKQIRKQKLLPMMVSGQYVAKVGEDIIDNWVLPISQEWLEKYDPALPALLIRSDIFEIVNFDKECKLGGDSFFFQTLRVKGLFKVCFMNEVTTVFRMGGISTNTKELMPYIIEREKFMYKITGSFSIFRILYTFTKGIVKIVFLNLVRQEFYYRYILYWSYLFRREIFSIKR